ncbi:DUF6440 family protein [Nitrospirillum viridazoti]|uniref:DUF6440 domain-containing protein n=1 Tax=Nitrospirillum viridazoti CBAmc TaxID=1441467 RepID=A0A248JTE0_9PROT|nr:DUF6440 family protein [Nitrospirillum amazonense]ASG21378.1 hypothetical protein Y958_11480 [Nitrospirillum amazonense CBAmc]TWB33054.1 hypothetical protein FBZ91_115116 [Nitrospirillum amazonense]
MKAFIALAAMALLSGCEPQAAADTPGPGRWARVLTDVETGCQYLERVSGGALAVTPRLDGNGRPMGCHSPQHQHPDVPATPDTHW